MPRRGWCSCRLLLLWFGLGLWSKVVIVFIGALFPILINTYEGVRNADKVLINVVRSFGASEWDIARLVVVPNALPYIVAGLRLAIGRAVLGVVVAEFFGSQEGLGVMMVRAASRYQVDVVFAGLIVFAALSLVMTGRGQDDREPPEPLAAAARQRWRGKVRREQARPALFSVRATGRVRLAKCYPPLRSGRVRLAKRCVVHVQTLFLLWFCSWLRLRKLASFAENVKNGCAQN